jgi:release factor glutamine methyltransferase
VLPSQVLRRASTYLGRHGVESPEATAEILLMHILGTDRAGLFARSRGLDPAQARAFGRALCRRCAGTPVEHVTGERAFRRLLLEVRPGVFVPRPETEVVVEHALAEVAAFEAPIVVDVGTGTGAIALAIADERRDARVIASDRSPDAVALARDNATRLGLAVTVVEGDLFGGVPDDLRGTVDLVVANPPYLDREELDALPPDVRADPEEALVGGPSVIRRLAHEALAWLRPGGRLVLEIASGRAAVVCANLAQYTDVHVEPDLVGRDRVVVATRT